MTSLRNQPAPATFLRSFLREFLASELDHHRISVDQYQDELGDLRASTALREIADRLFREAPRPTRIPGYGDLRIVKLLEPTGKSFHFLLGLRKTDSAPRTVKCFVGHRFRAGVQKALRLNLRHLLAPYGIELVWPNSDLAARDLFPSIVDSIRGAHMCIFDNFGTDRKPNVYLEVGIAYALGKPMIVCDYRGKSSAAMQVPSDLAGLVRVQYRTYEKLCRQLYFGLPEFLTKNSLDVS